MARYEAGHEVNPFTDLIASIAPEWALDGGCGADGCDYGALIYPDVRTPPLALHIRDALLHSFGEVAWCCCPFGQARKAAAEKTLAAINSAYVGDGPFGHKGVWGEYISPLEVAALRGAVADWHEQQDAMPELVIALPEESVGMSHADALAVLRGDDDDSLPF